MITNDATLLKIKHEVLYEVAKLAYAGRLEDERDDLPYKMVRARSRHSVVVYIEKGKLSGRESDLQKAKRRALRMMAILFRLLILPARTLRSPGLW